MYVYVCMYVCMYVCISIRPSVRPLDGLAVVSLTSCRLKCRLRTLNEVGWGL